MDSAPGRGTTFRVFLPARAMKILVIEDDRTVGQYVKRGLEEQRYQADLVDDGMEGLRLASGGRYDLIVLDLRLPGMSGFEVLRTLRDRGNDDAGAGAHRAGRGGLQGAGAALRARTTTSPSRSRSRSCWPGSRRSAAGPKEIATPVLQVGDLELDTATREVRRAGERIDLTPKEYTVLEYLMRHTGRVMSRTLITEYAWDYHFDPGTNIVDVVINRLRKKVDSGHAQKLVHTVRGVGYVVKAEMTTIRRRLTFWYTVALGAHGVRLRNRCCTSSAGSPASASWTSASLLEADLADRWLRESYNVLGRIVTTAGGRPALDPGISAYLEAVRD